MCWAAMAAFAIDATIKVKPSKPRIVFRIIFLPRSPSFVMMPQAQATRRKYGDVQVGA
jgi:hypothetical protein